MEAGIRKLDLNLLKVFDAILSTGSVSGAARHLGVSQPSVSRGLSRLRDHFDDPLFERAGNGVVPTAKASAMIDTVRQALALIEGAVSRPEAFDPAVQTRHFRLIMPDPAEFRVMPALINRLPLGSRVSFECLAFSGVDPSRAFNEEGVDAGVVLYLPDATDIVYRQIATDRGALVTRRNHPLLADGLDITAIGRLAFISLPGHIHRLSHLDEVLNAHGLTRRIVCTTHKISAIPHIVATTDLVSFLPLDFAKMVGGKWDIDVIPLPAMGLAGQPFYVAHARTATEDPGVQWVCDEIERAYGDSEEDSD